MSAATWDVDYSTAPTRMPVTPRRGHLTLVPAGSSVAVEPVRRSGAGSRVRLTRWGRLVITLTLLVAAITVAAAMFAGGATTPSGTVGSVGTVTVQADQTLSEIAARELPSLPIREGVARLQVANNLSSNQVHAGQTLQVPAS